MPPLRKDGLIPRDGLTLSAMEPASIPILLLMGIKFVSVWKAASLGIPVNAISQPLMPTGDGTTIKLSFISGTPFTCSASTMQTSALTFFCISVFWMPDTTTASVTLSPSGNSGWITSNDNYTTYNLCQNWNIRPFIDLNSNHTVPCCV